MKLMPIVGIASATVLSTLLAIRPPAVQAQTAEEREVIAVVEKFFQGMAARDTAVMRSTVDPSARLMGAQTQNGVTTIRPIPMANFITNIGNSPRDRGEPKERIYSPEVRIDGDLAQVWTFYTFHVGETFSHCGYDAFHLLRTHEGWKIVNVADSRRTTNCDPPGRR
jgi:hypothetical protein